MRRLLVGALLAAGLSLVGYHLHQQLGGLAPPARLTPPDLEEAGQLVRAFFQAPDAPLPAVMNSPSDPIYVALRTDGREIGHAWGEGNSRSALDLVAALKAAQGENSRVDSVEFCLTYDFQKVSPDALTYAHSGLWGLEMKSGEEHPRRLSPLEMITRNVPFRSIFQGAPWPPSELRRFQAVQGLVILKDKGVIRLDRGHHVEAENPDKPRLESFVRAIVDVLARLAQQDGGHLPYMVFPNKGEETERSLLLVRPGLATWSLARATRQGMLPDSTILDLNLEWMFAHYLRHDGKLAYLATPTESPLGATAVVALALWEHPHPTARQIEIRDQLDAGIDSLWQPDGAFHTSFIPGRKGNEEYYPGESLLELAIRNRHNPTKVLQKRLKQSYIFYREHHRRRRAPAFVPWQTMAYCEFYRQNPQKEYADWIFEMNDELVATMQPTFAEADLNGAFCSTRPPAPRVNKQRPHASSTAVYLDGLIDAFVLARNLGDKRHQERYRKSILKGLHELMVMQFRDDADLFFVPTAERERVRGSIRSNPWDCVVREDNGPHCILAGIKILREFTPQDYLP